MPDSLIDLGGFQVGAEDFLVAVLETVAQPVWVVDPDGIIRFANPAAIAALGYESADELSGCRSHETIHHTHPDGTPFPAEDCPMLLPRATGETVARDLDWFFRRDGSMFPVSYVSVPIELEEGRGAVVAFTDIEERLRAEREVRERDEILAAQQASVRRVAALVAGGAGSAEVFAAVAGEVASLLELDAVEISRYEPGGAVTVIGAWSDRVQPLEARTRRPLDGAAIATLVERSRKPVRLDDYADLSGTIAEAARASGICSGAGAPIIVDGRVWGVMATYRRERKPLPDRVEDRLAEFTTLVAAAFSNTASRAEVARLADEQASLRRVATLVARQSSPAKVFGAVADEVAQLLDTEAVGMLRFEPGEMATLVAQSATPWDPPALGTRLMLDGENVVARVLQTGESARLDDWADASGSVAAMARSLGVRSSVATPIVVEGRLWGAMVAATSRREPLPAGTDARLVQFTELVATAIANAEARGQLAGLAEEQAALRRVATRVAERVQPGELFGAVTEEVGRLLDADLAGMIRYLSDDTITAVATWAAEGAHPEAQGLWSLEGDRIASTILRTRRPAREDDWSEVRGPIAAFVMNEMGVHSSVGSPIVVEGQIWGALFVHSKRPGEPLPRDTESRLTNFAELVATAISNSQARDEVDRLAQEQAALRRVATLVAQERPAAEVFARVAEEAGRLLGVESTGMFRYQDDGTASMVASWGELAAPLAIGTRLALGGENVTSRVFRTGRPARIDHYASATGSVGRTGRELGVRSAAGTPIVVDGRLWGAMVVGSIEPLPGDTESRIGQFNELVATAISNIETRADLAASRARIVAAADEERRRVVRDLHDGAQQRLVHTAITLNLARRALERGDEVAPFVAEALDQAERATNELRELAHGIMPAVLARGGLRSGVDALASRMPVPVKIDVGADRLPAAVEATGYFVVAEALTNVAKHARAAHAEVTADVESGTLRVRVRDDGIGGARLDGRGLVGLADRLAAIGGRVSVDSPAGGGTLLAADIPLPG